MLISEFKGLTLIGLFCFPVLGFSENFHGNALITNQLELPDNVAADDLHNSLNGLSSLFNAVTPAPDISGTWKGTARIEGIASTEVTFSLNQDGENVSGIWEGNAPYPTKCNPFTGTITGTVIGSVFSFTATDPWKNLDTCEVICESVMTSDLTIADDTLTGYADEISCDDGTPYHIAFDLNYIGGGSSGSSPPVVQVPNGGEVWNGGSQQTISWNTENTESNKRLRFYISTDNGATWKKIGSSANTGYKNWKVPKKRYVSTQALLKICVKQSTPLCDVSDAVFTINQVPVADAGAKQTVAAGTQVVLDGTASYDEDFGPAALSYRWTQMTGSPVTLNAADTATPHFIPTDTGTYRFSLIVNDGSADSKEDKVKVKVKEAK